MRISTPARLATAAAVALTLAIAGCSTPNSQKKQDPAAPGEAVNLTVWGEASGEGATEVQTVLKAFNDSHPDIKVKYVVQEDLYTKFLTASTSGQPPDVMLWDRWQTATYAPKNVLLPLDDRLDKDGISKDQFYGEAVRELTHDDKLYGVPLTVDARALFYNKAHFKEAGLEPPTTWAELEQAAVKLTKRTGTKLTRAGMSLGDVGLFSMYLRQAGGEMVNEDCTKTAFNTPEGVAALDLWSRMVKAGVYKHGFEDGLKDGTDAFATGKVSMTLTGPWSVATYRKYGKDLDFGIVPPPAGPNGDKGSMMGGFGLAIPQASKQHDAAWELVKWWTAQKDAALLWAKTSRNIPGTTAVQDDAFFTSDETWKPLLETLEFAKVRPTCTGYSPMEGEAVIPNLQLFIEGKQTAEQTLKKAQDQGDKLLAQNN